MVINDLGATLREPFQHWVTLHSNYAEDWRRYRARHAPHKDREGKERWHERFLFHARGPAKGVDVAWTIAHTGSVTGIFAGFVALMLGYEDITLAGCPQDGSGHYFDPPWEEHKDFSVASNEQPWLKALPILRGKVRSLSGKTKEWLSQ